MDGNHGLNARFLPALKGGVSSGKLMKKDVAALQSAIDRNDKHIENVRAAIATVDREINIVSKNNSTLLARIKAMHEVMKAIDVAFDAIHSTMLVQLDQHARRSIKEMLVNIGAIIATIENSNRERECMVCRCSSTGGARGR